MSGVQTVPPVESVRLSEAAKKTMKRIMERFVEPFEFDKWNNWLKDGDFAAIAELKLNCLIGFAMMEGVYVNDEGEEVEVQWGFYTPTPLADKAEEEGLLDVALARDAVEIETQTQDPE